MSRIVLLFLFSVFFSVKGCPAHQLKALLRFRSTLNEAEELKSWKGDECCEWNGVKCDGTHNVSELNLRDFGLRSISGEIDSSLFELKHLSFLDLQGNFFHGEIPSQLGKLSSLRYLHLESGLSSCLFYGDHLYFSCKDDILTSHNLQWLSNLSSLEYLSLPGVLVNDKSWGTIVGSLLHLKHLDLSWCCLAAPTIPTTLLNLSSLTYLDLSFNFFSNVPTWMGELSSLTHLDLRYNNMSGSFANTIGNVTHLEYLDLSFNAFTGQIPVSLGHNHRQCASLSHINLFWNKLEGNIPSSLGVLLNLTFLSLARNQLTGDIPDSLGNLHNIRTLSLHDNRLSGSLPVSFAHLSSLTYLDVSDNNLNGSIPSQLMLPSSLQFLDLSNKSMSGSITEVFFQKSSELEELDLSESGLRINISSHMDSLFSAEEIAFEKLSNWRSNSKLAFHSI